MFASTSPKERQLMPELVSTKALILANDPQQAQRLRARLSSLGIETCDAICASGAAAVLRQEELNGKPIDFLFVDGHFGEICGMSLCAALCVTLRQRPQVLLTAPLFNSMDNDALARSGISAVIDSDSPSEDLCRQLLAGRQNHADALPKRSAAIVY